MTKHARMRSLLPAAFAAALIAGMGSSRAAPVNLRGDPSAPELAVVKSVYGPFLKAHPEIKLETAQMDLQGKNVASVFVRFVSKGTCSDDRCETSVLFYSHGSWRSVLQHTAASISIAPAAALPGADGMSSLVLDGVRWIWTGLDHYIPDISSLGDTFGRSRVASRAASEAALAAMKADPGIAPTLDPRISDFRATTLDLGSGAPALLVRAYAPGMCSNVSGCPHALVIQSGNAYKVLWTGLIPGVGAVLGTSTNGLKDIAFGEYRGYGVYSFDGTAYRLTMTSYPSPTTPSP